jgi:hypothetical protein
MQTITELVESNKYTSGNYIPFVSEVEEFNKAFDKLINEEPTIAQESDWRFVYNFILEELEEYRESCEKGDVVGALDAICDITYVSLGNGVLTHGLKDSILPAYVEVHKSNMSKSCSSLQEAEQTVELRSKEQGEPCHYEQPNYHTWVVYRTRDRKVMKSINYFKPNLKQFITNVK